MIRLLILDFDGTIIQSNYIKQISINHFAKFEFGYSVADKVNKQQIKNLTRYQQLCRVKGAPLTIKENLKIDQYVNEQVLKANMDSNFYLLVRICRIRKIKVFLVSNTPDHSLNYLTKKLNIDYLFDGIFGKRNNQKKSSVFWEILQSMSIKPQQCLSVGDDYCDYLASKDCNIPFIGIRHESLSNLSENIKKVANLRGIINFLEKNDLKK